ncbi:MAG: 50S ribosomal protein L20 [bacterium]
MPRVKRGKSHLKRRKNILKQVKGYNWGRKKLLKLAKTAIVKAGASALRDRRVKKREKRALWQIKISNGLKSKGLSYSKFINSAKKANIELNRKMLADIIENNPKIFDKILEAAGSR